jgi:uncharacterized membrane protein (UPF0127 family)
MRPLDRARDGERDLRPRGVAARVTDRRIVHEPGDAPDERVIATEVERAESMLARARGLMFRSSLPDEYALVLETGTGLFGRPARQAVHMLFVRCPLDVVWLVEDEVERVARMQPWRSVASARADRILELPAGSASDVEPGDTVRVESVDDS